MSGITSRILGPFRRSLQARLVAYFLALSTVTVLVVGVIVYARATGDLTASVYDRLDAVAGIKADALDRWIDEQSRNVVFVGVVPGVGDDARAFLDPETPSADQERGRGPAADPAGHVRLSDRRCRRDLRPRAGWHRPALDAVRSRGCFRRDRAVLHDGLVAHHRPERVPVQPDGAADRSPLLRPCSTTMARASGSPSWRQI